MIPSEIQEIFGAMIVGITSLLIFGVACWILVSPKDSFFQWIFKGKNKLQERLYALILLLFAFGLGLIVQDFTDQLTDSSEYIPNKSLLINKVSKIQRNILCSEGELRFRTLIKKERGVYGLRVLGKDIFLGRSDHVHFLVQPKEGEDYEFLADPKLFLNGSRNQNEKKNYLKDRLEKAEGIINKIYHPSKNWVYSQPTYYDEMEKIQRRIDFSRSIFILASWAIIYIFLATLGSLLFRVMKIAPFAKLTGQLSKGNNAKILTPINYRKLLYRSLIALLLFSIMCIISLFGYHHAEEIFNERCFGYYSSHLQRETWIKSSDNNEGLNSALWLHTSAEYESICRQTFKVAFHYIKESSKKHWASNSEERLGIVMDLDETVLDNTFYNLFLLAKKLKHSSELWRNWIRNYKNGTRLVPGVTNFLDQVQDMGIEVVFISNRPDSEFDATVRTLESLGVVPLDTYSEDYWKNHLFLKKNSESKISRRKIVEDMFKSKGSKKHGIIAYLGDNLADFSGKFEEKESKDYRERRSWVSKFVDKWGTEWFVLPNPIYGDWRTLLSDQDVLVILGEAIEMSLSVMR
jgi:acid phosphatase